MPVFIYKAVDQTGALHAGRINKNNLRDAENSLLQSYPALLELYPLSESRDLILPEAKLSLKELAMFCRRLSFFLEAGYVVGAALQHVWKQTRRGRTKKVIGQLYEQIMGGESLWSAMEKTEAFPELLIGMVKVGEQSGKIAFAVGEMGSYYEKESTLNEELKNALIYPVSVTVMILAVIIVFVTYVVPSYALVFFDADMELPLPTRVLLRISEFVSDHPVVLGVSFVAVLLATLLFFRSRTGRLCSDWLKLHCFVVRDVHRRQMSLCFVQALHVLMSAGLDIAPAMEIACDVVTNRIMLRALRDMMVRMRQGAPLSRLIPDISGLDPVIGDMLYIGEETGRMTDAMSYCAAQFRIEMSLTVTRASKIIEPLVIVLLGAVLAFVMLAVMLPTFYMTNAF